MEEVKRFFESINFSYKSDFDNTVIDKVILNKKLNKYTV